MRTRPDSHGSVKDGQRDEMVDCADSSPAKGKREKTPAQVYLLVNLQMPHLATAAKRAGGGA